MSHRGASGLATENSTEAIKIGDSFHPDYIEVDVNLTSDDVPVVYHGELKRTYIGRGTGMSYSELKQHAPTILTVSELFALKTKSPYILDIKTKTIPNELIQLLDKYPKKDWAFTSPHVHAMHTIQKLRPNAKIFISQPYQEGPFRPIELARNNKFTGISLNKWWLGPVVYWLCQHHKLEIMVYTIDRPFTMWLVKKLFPRVFIVTNRPDIFKRIDSR